MSTDLLTWLIILSGTARVTAFFLAVLAVHDIIRNGLHVRIVPWSARILLYLAGVSLCLSGMAAMFRIYGEPWAPVFRECAHGSVSLGIIGVAILVMRAPSCVGDQFNAKTGRRDEFIVGTPEKARDRSFDTAVA